VKHERANNQAKELERAKHAAVVNRKRSSRIATRELEREEQLRLEKAQLEMEERMERSRREENGRSRDQAQIVEDKKTREDRLREREERQAARGKAVVMAGALEGPGRFEKGRRRSGKSSNGRSGTPEGWHLRCEVCHVDAWNPVSTNSRTLMTAG
jgi:hypothetical protein